MRLFLFALAPSIDRINPVKRGPYKGLEVTTLDDLLDLLCYGTLLFLSWYKLWERVYFREDENND